MAEGELTDEGLLAGMALGEQAAAVTFVRRYQRRIFGLAYSMTGDAGVAEDVAQEAMVRVWKHAPVFDPRRGSVSSWVLTITRNLAIDAVRVRRSDPADPAALAALLGAADVPGPAELAEAGTDRRTLIEALSRLPVEQRRALVLATIGGRTSEEVSAAEGIPLGTAKTRIRAALHRLRIDLAQPLIDEVDGASRGEEEGR